MTTVDETSSVVTDRLSYIVDDDSPTETALTPIKEKEHRDKDRLKSPDRKKKKRKEKEKEKERDREKKETSALIQKFVEVSFFDYRGIYCLGSVKTRTQVLV